MSHDLSSNTDTSGFNYPSAAGVPTNVDQTHVGVIPTGDSLSVPIATAHSISNAPIEPSLDRHQGKLEGEHGGAGTRADDRQGINVTNDGHTATPVAKEEH